MGGRSGAVVPVAFVLVAVVVGALLGGFVGYGLAPRTDAALPRSSGDGRESVVREEVAQGARPSAMDESLAAVEFAAAPAPAARRESASDLAAALAEAPQYVARRGDGVIRGRVATRSGEPVAGAVVVARPLRNTGERDVRIEWLLERDEPATLEQALADAALAWSLSDGAALHDITDADGRFEIAGLDPTLRFGVSARKEHMRFHAAQHEWQTTIAAVADDFVRLVARPLVRVRVDVVDESGFAFDEALVVTSPNMDSGSRRVVHTWRSDDPFVELDIEEAGSLLTKTSFRAFDGLRSRRTFQGWLDADRASDAAEFENERLAAGADAPVVRLVVRTRRSIFGRLRADWMDVESSALTVTAVDVATGATAFTKSDGGAFRINDLGPGRYRVWARYDDVSPQPEYFVDVADGPVEQDLELVPTQPVQQIVLRLETLQGEPLAPQIVRLRAFNGNFWQWRNTALERIDDGVHALRSLGDNAALHGAWPEGFLYVAWIAVEGFGEREIEFEEGRREYVVVFEDPARLVVACDPRPRADGAKLAFEAPRQGDLAPFDFYRSRPLGADGIVEIGPLAPGPRDVMAILPDGVTLRRSVGSLGSGTTRVDVDVPLLHAVTFDARTFEGRGAVVRRIAEVGDWEYESSYLIARGTVAEHRLPVGRYVATWGESASDSIAFEVPGDAVVVGPPPPNALRVEIDSTRGLLAAWGLEGGDVVVEIGGRACHDVHELWQALSAAATSATELTVVRRGRFERVEVGPLGDAATDLARLGGTLVPVVHP